MNAYPVHLTLPPVNPKLNAHNKGNWKAKAKPTRELRQLAKRLTEAKFNGQQWPGATVNYFFYFKDKRRRDTANAIQATKPAIDGVVDAGLIPDDAWRFLQIGGAMCAVDRKNPRVELLFLPYDPDAVPVIPEWPNKELDPMKILTGKKAVPRRTMLYGVHGVGKSTWAADAPNPIFLNIEDGINDLDTTKTEHLKEWGDISDALQWLCQEEHDFKTVVSDTADWIEAAIFRDIATAANVEAIADIPYGAGYKKALAYWDKVLNAFEYLRSARSMNIVLLAHADVYRFNDPEGESYDRYQPALHKAATAKLQEWCDEVFFAQYRKFTSTEDQGFNKKRTIGVDAGGERYLRTCESAAVNAKNRLSLPAEIPMSWADYQAAWPTGSNEETVVDDGSAAVVPVDVNDVSPF